MADSAEEEGGCAAGSLWASGGFGSFVSDGDGAPSSALPAAAVGGGGLLAVGDGSAAAAAAKAGGFFFATCGTAV